MEILMLTGGMDIGGAETHVRDLCRALGEAGHRVTLLTAGGRFADGLAAFGVQVRIAPTVRRGVGGLLLLSSLLRRQLEEHSYDALHAHTRYTAAVAEWVCARMRGTVPALTVTAHLPCPAGWGRFLSRPADSFLAVSEDIALSLQREFSLPYGRITRTVNGIDPALFPLRELTGHAIIHVSRLSRGRSAAAIALCRAAPGLLAKHREYTLRIVGDGDDMASVRAAAEEANRALGEVRVILRGRRYDIGAELSAGNIFVGVSRAALEAGCQGLPVILAGDEGYGGILTEERFAEMARTNFCARGCAPLTQEALQADLERLIGSESLRKSIHGYLPSRIRKEYTLRRMGQDALTAYRLSAAHAQAERTFLIGYYGRGNLGDDTGLSLLRQEYPAGRVRTMGSRTSKRRGTVGVKDLPALLGQIRNSDAVVLGGGTLLQNESSRRSLHYYLSLMEAAGRRGSRLSLLGGGVGEIRGAADRRRTAAALALCEDIALRTAGDIAYTKALLEEAGTPAAMAAIRRIRYMPDICFWLKSPREETENLLTLIPARSAGGKKEPPAMWEAVRQLCHRMGLRARVMCLFRQEDEPQARRAAQALGASLLLPKTGEEAARELGRGRLTVSNRLHGLIFSLCAGVPAVALRENAKIRYLREDAEKICAGGGLPCPLLPPAALATLTPAELLARRAGVEPLLSSFRAGAAKAPRDGYGTG